MYISKFLEMKNEASEPDIKIVDLMEKCLLIMRQGSRQTCEIKPAPDKSKKVKLKSSRLLPTRMTLPSSTFYTYLSN